MTTSQEMPLRTLPVAHEAPDERRFWAKLRRVLARIPFAEDLVAAYYCALVRILQSHSKPPARACQAGACHPAMLP